MNRYFPEIASTATKNERCFFDTGKWERRAFEIMHGEVEVFAHCQKVCQTEKLRHHYQQAQISQSLRLLAFLRALRIVGRFVFFKLCFLFLRSLIMSENMRVRCVCCARHYRKNAPNGLFSKLCQRNCHEP